MLSARPISPNLLETRTRVLADRDSVEEFYSQTGVSLIAHIENAPAFEVSEDFISSETKAQFYRKNPLIPREKLAPYWTELCRFLLLRSSGHRSFIPMSDFMDELWHHCMLQTEDYVRMCENLPGKTFIHHHSISFPQHIAKHSYEKTMNEQFAYLSEYLARFGAHTSGSIACWRLPSFLTQVYGLTPEDLNSLQS